MGQRPDDPREIETAVISMRLSGGSLAVLDQSWLHPTGYDNPDRAHLRDRGGHRRPVATYAVLARRLAAGPDADVERLPGSLRGRLSGRAAGIPRLLPRGAGADEQRPGRAGGDAHRRRRHPLARRAPAGVARRDPRSGGKPVVMPRQVVGDAGRSGPPLSAVISGAIYSLTVDRPPETSASTACLVGANHG